ncbi:hypothetical protein [Vibrio mediterranei]|uniref:hypothetical protein n=1 Tax=Vibrio mediterranei TaxID=689 RepID=UPI004067F2D1
MKKKTFWTANFIDTDEAIASDDLSPYVCESESEAIDVIFKYASKRIISEFQDRFIEHWFDEDDEVNVKELLTCGDMGTKRTYIDWYFEQQSETQAHCSYSIEEHAIEV